MSATLTIDAHELEDLQVAVETLGGAITGDDVRKAMGNAVANVLLAHFAELAQDSTHHKTAQSFGAAPTGVYEEARRGVQQPELEGEGVSVTINQRAIAQRFFGGDIEPVNAKFLAIPARTESYGKRPGEFDNLRFILFPSGAGALVERDATKLTRKGKQGAAVGGLVFFWLVKQVHQDPDPSVLPTEDAMLEAAMQNAQSYVSRVWDERRAAA